jgi:predicted Zn-dependent protease
MLNLSCFFSRCFSHRWFYPLLSLVTAIALVIGTPLASRAIDWFSLFQSGVQLIQASNISDKQEVSLGKDINDQLLSSGQIQLYQNQQVNSYVNSLGQRLAANSERPNIPYKFQVVADKSVNAFATMGGYVYVHSGLLKTADNEAQLAGVMGHEIGHIARRHAVKQMKQAALAQGLEAAAGINHNTAVQIGTQLAIQRPRSRQNEYEADQQGLATVGRTGYPQTAMVDFMKKLLNAPSPPTFLSDHPGTPERIVALQKAIDPAKADVKNGLDSAAYRSQISPLLGSQSGRNRS